MAGTLQGGRLSGISLNSGTIGGITLSGGAIPRGGGLSRVQIMSLYYLFRAAAYTDPDAANLFANFKTAFGITDPVNITGISINATASVEETLTTPLTITLSPANADEQYSASWTSANTGIATVNGSGVVSGVSEGSTTITCSVTTFSGNTFTATCAVTVTEKVAAVTSITAVYTQSGTVYDTASLDDLKSDLVVTAYYDDSTSGVVPSANYTLSGTLSVGTSTITVSYGGKTTTFTVTVTEYVPYYPKSLTYTDDGVGFGSTDIAKPTYTPPYVSNTSKNRVHLLNTDSLGYPVESGKTYKVSISNYDAQQVGVTVFNEIAQANLENLETVSASNRTDSGWQTMTSGEYTFTPTYINNSAPACIWISFRKNSSNASWSGTIDQVEIFPVTISEVSS